jgi:general secretion pathway protein I
MSPMTGRSELLRSRNQAGFTLIEMLVALVVFSLAALALLRAQGATASNTFMLEQRTLAEFTAQSIAVEALTDPTAPALGSASGTVANGQEKWLWLRTTRLSEEPRILQIDVRVRSQIGPAAAQLTVFRRSEK